MKPKVSIILPLYNSEEFVEECLDNLLNQSFKDFELIILDDCSKDKTREILERKQIKYYKNKENLGFARNLNIGIKIAKGEYIMIADHDMIYDKDYLKEMVSEEKEIISSKCYYYNEPERIRSFGISINLLTGKTNVTGRDELDYGQFDNLKEIKLTGTPQLMIRRGIFKRVGFFDETFNKYYMDLDFCSRARQMGFNISLSKAKCWHKKEKTEVFNKQQLKSYYQDKKLFLKKHSHHYPLPLIPMNIKKYIRRNP